MKWMMTAFVRMRSLTEEILRSDVARPYGEFIPKETSPESVVCSVGTMWHRAGSLQ
jgi:hypothetical protein